MAGSGKEKSGNDSDFSRIVELIKENTFSREEISRFLDILNSKTEQLQDEKPENGNVKDTQIILRTDEVPSIPSQEKKQDFSRASTVRFHEDSDRSGKVDASPIDIARAYMASCTSGGGDDRHKFMSKYEQAPPSNFPSGKGFSPSPSPKPLICWPGAILHEYSTPRDQRRRQRIQDFTRSPYSRSTLLKSTTKFPVDGRYEYPSTPLQQPSASSYRQEKSSRETVGEYGSTGPIRHARSRFASDFRPRLSVFSGSDKQVSSRVTVPQAPEGSLPGKQKSVEPDKTLGANIYSGENAPATSDRDIGYMKLSSSQAVRTILEHLDREKPTPKEKEAELQLATSWRGPSVPRANDTIHVENGGSMHIAEPTSNLNSDKSGSKYIKFKFVGESVNNGTSEAKDSGKGKAIVSEADNSASRFLHGVALEHSFAPKSGSFALNKGVNEATTNSIFSSPHFGSGRDMRMTADSELSRNHVPKLSLPSLAISKPGFGGATSPGSCPTFTFPYSATSGVLSDLPTPSLFPSTSASAVSVPAAAPTIPTYTFGASRSTPRLVFSFPSTASTLTTHGDSDPIFKFGSDNNNTRLSFASLGKDAVCC